MHFVLKILRIMLLIIVVIGIAAFLYRDHIERSPLQKEFLTGVAEPLPDGFYKGSSPSLPVGSWRGKQFNATEAKGVNVLESAGKREFVYPFRMVKTKGSRDHALDVIKIDYSLPENPWLLRNFAYDEIVRLADGRYLGKIQIEIIRGFPFTIGYFWQEK